MPLEIGQIIEGKITGVTNFGAFVELPEKKSGMVHISEVSSTFIKDIKEHVKVGQTVKVKIISIGQDGKINLSIKQAADNDKPQPKQKKEAPKYHANPGQSVDFNIKVENQSFEEMMASFKKISEDKMSDIKRNLDNKRGSGKSGKHSK